MTHGHDIGARAAKCRLRSMFRAGLGFTFLASGCANLLGIETDNTKVDCVTVSDCNPGFACVAQHCVCDGCGQGGAAGQGGGTSGLGGSVSPEAGEAGSGVPQAGTGALGGEAGAAPQKGGAGGKSAAGGRGGTHSMGGGSGEAGEGAAAGSAGDAGECDPDVASCFVCDETRHVVPGSPCEAVCENDGACKVPLSCDGPIASCSSLSCCLAEPVPSGDFNRSCDDDCHRNCAMGNQDFPARVAPFALDAFEVTVGRFRRFVSHYPAAKPLPTAGANPKNAADVGWHEEWDALLPATQADLIAKLGSVSCDAWATWTDTEGSSEDLPINCVSWYVAQAFCIWDGGRLPTDAEWYYVASGGESRVYPWSHPPGEATIGKDYANYLPAGTGGPVAVGSYPSGRGRWQHYDLGGNVAEWVWDGLRDCYSSTDLCDNCGETDALPQKIVRGGYFNDDEQPLRTETRRAYTATDARSIVGFRCARGL